MLDGLAPHPETRRLRHPVAGWRRLPATLAALALAAVLNACASAPSQVPLGVFYPAAPDTARYQFLTRIYDSSQVHKLSALEKLIRDDPGPFRFGKLYGVTMVGPRIYLVDTQMRGVLRLDLERHRMELIPAAGALDFETPINITRDAEGNKYVADSGGRRVVVLGPHEELLRVYGDGRSFAPIDVAVGDRYLYVVDKDSHSVLLLDRRAGEQVGTCDASPDSVLPQMAFPTNVALAPDGSIYVTDTVGCRVFHFDEEGEYLGAFGQQGSRPGDFVRPKGVAVDDRGRVFVVDAAFENVQVFTPDGVPLTFLGGPGRGPGKMFLPAGVALSHDGLDRFRTYAHEGVELDELVLVTSQFGPAHLDVYGRIANIHDFARRFPPDRAYQPADSLSLRPGVRSLEDVSGGANDGKAKGSSNSPPEEDPGIGGG